MAHRSVNMMEIDGEAQLKRLFRDLPRRVATNMARRALYAGALPIRDAARAKVPVRFGALKRAIVARSGQEAVAIGNGRFARTGNLKAYVSIGNQKQVLGLKRSVTKFRAGPGRKSHRFDAATWTLVARAATGGGGAGTINPRRYAHLVEFGTSPHSVKAGSSSRSRKGDRGVKTSGAGKTHPGSAPKPFMRPAFDAQANNAMGIISRAVGEMVAEYAKGLSRGSKRKGGT